VLLPLGGRLGGQTLHSEDLQGKQDKVTEGRLVSAGPPTTRLSSSHLGLRDSWLLLGQGWPCLMIAHKPVTLQCAL
jgi:hypothetical protein